MKGFYKRNTSAAAARASGTRLSRASGFTLVELMVSIILGLLLVAAAIQLFINGQVAYKVQQAGATVQDNGVFGLSYMTQSIRLANYGNTGPMNDETLFGGIVLSGEQANSSPARDGNLNGMRINGSTTAITTDDYLTANAKTSSAYGTAKSDQLVIMYQAPQDMQNCAGENVTGPVKTMTSITRGQYVIERYYIKKDGANAVAALYCDAGIFSYNEADEIARKSATGLNIPRYGTGGVMIANNVEYMRVQLMVRPTKTTTQIMPINTYKALTITDAADASGTTPATSKTYRPAITGINLGLLVRSTDKAGSNQGAKTYQVMDQSITAPDDGYIRNVYLTTIALRNGGLGEVIE